MRAWLYDALVQSPLIQAEMDEVDIADRVLPRRSQNLIPDIKPYLIFGLGNSTDEQLGDSTAQSEEDLQAERQFFQVWVHDEDGNGYTRIDRLVEAVKKTLAGRTSPAHRVLTVIYLETSAEFSNQTYNTGFRYIRFQAVLAKGIIPQ